MSELEKIFSPAQIRQLIELLWNAVQHSSETDQSVTIVFKRGHPAFFNGSINQKVIKPESEIE